MFEALQAALEFDPSKMESITILNDAQGYKYWKCKGAIQAGRVYVVLPNSMKAEGGIFKKKHIHAEELFYPILMELKKGAKLSNVQPAFIGGVKTPCRTCGMVLQVAAANLKELLILPTDAVGHYWPASGEHVPDATFTDSDVTVVFGSTASIKAGSIKMFSTEMPPSPMGD